MFCDCICLYQSNNLISIVNLSGDQSEKNYLIQPDNVVLLEAHSFFNDDGTYSMSDLVYAK